MSYEKIRDTGEECLFLKRFSAYDIDIVLVSIYSDNFHISGRRIFAVRVHIELKEHYGFSPENNYTLTDVIGMEREPFKLPDGQRALFIHQTQYAQHAIESYEKTKCAGRQLKGVTTPIATTEQDVDDDVPDTVPKLDSHDAASSGGVINWVARGTRYDLALTGKRVVQRQREWEAVDSAMLHRAMRYWKYTADWGIVMYGSPNDLPTICGLLEIDSDHGNDKLSPKSTASTYLIIYGESTHIPIAFGAKGNLATGRNTAEVEVVAIDRGTFHHGTPLVSTLERILQRTIPLYARSDNTAAVIAANKGYSRKLAYLSKHQRISLSALREVYVGAEEHEEDGEASVNDLSHLEGLKNRSDLGTKPVDHARHWELMHRCQMASLRDIRALQKSSK